MRSSAWCINWLRLSPRRAVAPELPYNLVWRMCRRIKPEYSARSSNCFSPAFFNKTNQLAAKTQPALPPILAGNASPDMRKRVEQFFFSAASLFEAWVSRRKSAHTQRAYRADVYHICQLPLRKTQAASKALVIACATTASPILPR